MIFRRSGNTAAAPGTRCGDVADPSFAVWFIARLAWLTPPAMMIQLATVGMVKYPNIPMIKKMMYTACSSCPG